MRSHLNTLNPNLYEKMTIKYNELISICVPTYNRSKILDDFLSEIVPMIKDKKISIIISDNCSTDSTKNVVESWIKIYENISYHINDSNLGSEKNFLIAQKLATTKYVWLIGDDDRLVKGSFEKVLNILASNNYEYIIVNGTNGSQGGKNRIDNINSKLYKHADELMNDIGWHITWISTVIVRRDLINDQAVIKYIDTKLSRVASLFEQMSYKKELNCYWIHDQVIFVQNRNHLQLAYINHILEIFIKDICEIANKLPSEVYGESAKLAFTRGHEHSLFSISNFAYYRLKGIFNKKEYIKYSGYFKYVTRVPLCFLLIVSITPTILLKILWVVYSLTRTVLIFKFK